MHEARGNLGSDPAGPGRTVEGRPPDRHGDRRLEGGLLLAYYLAYTLYLILAAAHHDALPGFSAVLLHFVIPLTALTLIIVAIREMRSKGVIRSE